MTTFRIPNRWFSLHFHDFVGECSPAGTFDLYVALLSLKPQIPTRIILFGCPIDYPTLLIGLKTGHQTGSAESTWNPTPSIFVRCLVRDADDPRHGFPRERQGSFPCRWGFPAMPPCVSPSLPTAAERSCSCEGSGSTGNQASKPLTMLLEQSRSTSRDCRPNPDAKGPKPVVVGVHVRLQGEVLNRWLVMDSGT